MEKTKKHQKHMSGAQGQEDMSRETMILRKRVKSLIKRNRVVEVRKLMQSEEPESWGRDTQAKVCYIETFFVMRATNLFRLKSYPSDCFFESHAVRMPSFRIINRNSLCATSSGSVC